ncbi:hypothetical protein HZ994_09350 [Akkermansiaceae bacterium]|nr:hypothetical protein HZ994_09350 [Akkermansiaceae bacterium]
MLFTNGQLLEHSEKAGSMMGVVAAGKDGYNGSTGEYFTVEKARVLYGQHQKAAEQIESSMEALNDKSALFYRIRNILLALGFFSLIASKVLEPYIQ